MLGPDEENSQNFDDLHRGIIPRCLEYLFQLIEKKQYMVSKHSKTSLISWNFSSYKCCTVDPQLQAGGKI